MMHLHSKTWVCAQQLLRMQTYTTVKSQTRLLPIFCTLSIRPPVDWCSKRQKTMETATYVSKLVAARIVTEQTMGLCIFLRDVGASVLGPSWMFEDNQRVITSSALPHSSLDKRHNSLAYHHCICSTVEAKITISVM